MYVTAINVPKMSIVDKWACTTCVGYTVRSARTNKGFASYPHLPLKTKRQGGLEDVRVRIHRSPRKLERRRPDHTGGASGETYKRGPAPC